MRILLIFSFIFCFSSSVVYAQDDALPDVPVTMPEISTEVNDDSPASEESQNVFAKASDDQIKEAQRFFRYCSDNQTLSTEKDCRCAATKYLETRLRLGEGATPEQIMAENRNNCLVDEADSISEDASADITKYSETDIEEAEEVYAQCRSSQRMRSAFDCECYASKFLEKRHEEGPMMQKDTIFIQLQTECKNVVDTTGREYSLCMSNPTFERTNGIERKKFCECYARQWAKNYENFTAVVDTKSRRHLKIMSRAHCTKPENYR